MKFNIYFQIFGDNRKHIPLIGGVFPTLAQVFRFFMLKFPLLGAANFIHVNKTVVTAVQNRIDQRENDRKNGIEIGEPQDFIDLFLEARADDVEHFQENNGDFSKTSSYVSFRRKIIPEFKKLQGNRQLTTQEIVGQCLVFLIAGFDTTALSLSYTTFLLATHPEVQKKLQEEIERECIEPSISFDHLSKLKYMDCIIKETLRLYPLGTM